MSNLKKILSWLAIAAVLLYYSHITTLSKELAAANTAIEQLSVSLTRATGSVSATSTAEVTGFYQDGVYDGTAQGYGGPVTTQLTIQGGNLVGIEVTQSDGEDAPYYNMCLGILDEIASEQSADDVDTVLGATRTSKGIIGGAQKAFAQAVK
jgi:uncharacterized protein with FMN-binding domain